jgi:hypothetical protein
MLAFLLIFPIPQTIFPPQPEFVVQQQEVRPLPGQLDNVPVFNSNSPELVLKEGILLSTFPSYGKKVPQAHLNFPFWGRFDIFAHHIAKSEPADNLRTLYLGIILHNPAKQSVKVNVLRGASYLSQPDAPFIELPPITDNSLGAVFAGPGDRVMTDILIKLGQPTLPAQIVIPPGQSQMLLNEPIPVKELIPPLNGRSTLIHLQSSGRIYAASLAMFAPINYDGSERSPSLEEWENLLNNADLAGPRDKIPTEPKSTKPIIYGRVAGVAKGSEWKALLVDRPKAKYLTIPKPGQAFSYALSTVEGGTLGTKQIQSAPMLVRYPDTAYSAHGNYGIKYSLKLPLYNNSQSPRIVTISMQTPLKEDKLINRGLRFLSIPGQEVFFRGTVQLRYKDEQSKPQTKLIHLVQKRGQQGEALAVLNLKAGDRTDVEVDLLYPPDATPPQVLTVTTQAVDFVPYMSR